MADNSAIEWTDSTWNPVRGCTRRSPGCGGPGPHGGCYAEKIAARFSDPGQPFHGFAERGLAGSKWTGKVALIPELLDLPLRWKRPRRIFVNSMSDLFHENLPDEAIDKVFAVMALAPQHTFQVLTKRAERMRDYCTSSRFDARARAAEKMVDAGMVTHQNFVNLSHRYRDEDAGRIWYSRFSDWPLPNIWLGVSAEDQERADERIPHLLATPASVRFLSCEPLLGPVDIEDWTQIRWQCSACEAYFSGAHKASCPVCGQLGGWSGSHRFNGRHNPGHDVGSGIDWVIAGAESGPRARPCEENWVRDIRDQCAAAGVPFFYKQSATPTGRKIPLPMLDGRQHAEYPA